MIPENVYEVIDSLIARDKSFAIWRTPGEEDLHFMMQSTGAPRLLYDIKDLNERSGFVIAPFQVTSERPIVLIEPDCLEIPFDMEKVERKDVATADECRMVVSTDEEDKADYERRFSIFLQTLLKGAQDKLVLSRSKTLPKSASFSTGKTFVAAARRYIYSNVYLIHTPETGTWMGGTPEILLSGEQDEWHTVALAGTQAIQDGRLPKSWDMKNWEEQQLVAAYIRRQLASLQITPEEKGPYTARAAEVFHLKSDFFFSMHDTNRLGDLLELIHPTPAVCGLPKDDAYAFILANEEYDRSYYSGFIGCIDPKGKTDLYVNLRCMNILADTFTLYAGGGLLAASQLEEEWQETVDKMETMRRLIR